MVKCQNPDCQKEIAEDKKYCNEYCLRKHLELRKKSQQIVHANEDVAEAIDSKPIFNNGFTNDLRDGAFQNGIKWRKGKLEAIYKARKAGLTDEQILRELRISGITFHKATELMKESEELFGR
jgi:hypothetical protein